MYVVFAQSASVTICNHDCMLKPQHASSSELYFEKWHWLNVIYTVI
jgi:hypothetical protein